MNKHGLNELLNEIKSKEGENFTYDENSLIEGYERVHAEPESLTIKILSIVGGMAATIAFLGFLLIGGLYDSDVGLISFGVLFVAAAVWLNRSYEKLIIDTVSVSLYVLGFAIFIMGLDDLDDTMLALMCLTISLGTLRFMQNYVLAFFATLAANSSIIVLIIEAYDSPNALHVFTLLITLATVAWLLNEAKLIASDPRISRLYYPVRIGLIVSMLTALIALSFGYEWGKEFTSWIASLVTIPATLYVVVRILKLLHVKDKLRKMQLLALALLILAPTVFAPYISGSILIILLCFLVNYRTGLVFGIIAFIYAVSRYYYDLNYSLLQKSMVLMISGVLLLGLYLVVHKIQTSDEAH